MYSSVSIKPQQNNLLLSILTVLSLTGMFECLAYNLCSDVFCFLASRGTERTVVMDKSKGEPVISVKTSTSKERVSTTFREAFV